MEIENEAQLEAVRSWIEMVCKYIIRIQVMERRSSADAKEELIITRRLRDYLENSISKTYVTHVGEKDHGNETEGNETSEVRVWDGHGIGSTDSAPDSGTSEEAVTEADSQKEITDVLPSENPDSERSTEEDDSVEVVGGKGS